MRKPLFQILIPRCILLLVMLPFLRSLSCFEINDAELSPRLGDSSWHLIEMPSFWKSNYQHALKMEDDTVHSSTVSSVATKGKRLVEWDDDEIITNSLFRNPDKVHEPSLDGFQSKNYENPSSRRPNRRWSKKAGKLIYHGHVKHTDADKTIDGIKLHIDTHQPVNINRRSRRLDVVGSSPLIDAPKIWPKFKTTSENLTQIKEDRESSIVTNLDDPKAIVPDNSNWRPVIYEKKRRHVPSLSRLKDSSNLNREQVNETLPLDSGWRPITYLVLEKKTSSSREVKKKSKSDREKQATFSLEEPFEVDGIIYPIHGGSNPNEQVREIKQINKKSNKDVNERWTPVETTTMLSSLIETTEISSPSSSTAASAASMAGNNHNQSNHSEPAQRSASDLNYIYSNMQTSPNQQTISDWMGSNRAQNPGGYYSNYASVQAQPTPDQGMANVAIVDSTSGQFPETVDYQNQMIPASAVSIDASITPSMAQTQPNQPVRASGYDASSYYYGPPPNRFQVPTRQVVSTTPAPNQFLRQEHHYHYYHQQPTQSTQIQPERQQIQVNQPSVIRELQPLLISQPIIQPPPAPSSTSPPPQLIREIIKEVPVQAMQIQPIQIPRIVLPSPVAVQPPPPPLPQIQLDHSYGSYSYAAPAGRIMRQISSSIPTMAVRQIRFPVPTIQLPIRIASSNPVPVTRQTGSFMIPSVPQKTTTYLTETQAMPTHTTIMHTTQFTPATRTTVYTTDHQPNQAVASPAAPVVGYKRK